MVKVIFVDLSRTIDIMRGEVADDMSLEDVLRFFAKEWNVEDITIFGKPITQNDLQKSARELSPGWYRDFEIQIEKHR